jgi:hypothetical protein
MSDVALSTPVAAIGGIALKAAGLIATTTAHTEVDVGHGGFVIQADWTAVESASNDELFVGVIEANSEAADSTWKTIGFLFALGATEVLASMGDAPAAGSIRAAYFNPYDYKIRIKTFVSGTVGSGINFAAKLYPMKDLIV